MPHQQTVHHGQHNKHAATANGTSTHEIRRRIKDRSELRQHRHQARLYAMIIYAGWFIALSIGILAYQGEPILVKSKDLPLHFFNEVFKRAGSAFILILWSLRAAASHLMPSFPRHQTTRHIWVPGFVYFIQAGLRFILYKLHMAGTIFSPRQWHHWHLPRPAMHPEHVMSDHILLGASVVAACGCEAIIAVVSLRYASKHRVGKVFLHIYAATTIALAALICGGSFFTSKYFHPPSEIVMAAVFGLVIFQIPLLYLAARSLHWHSRG